MSNAAKDRFLRLQALYRSGDLEGAASALAAALRASPKEPNLLHLAAQVADAQGDRGRALLFFRRAIDAHPNWFEARYNLALTLHKDKQAAEALSEMLRVTRDHPDRPQAQEALARFYQEAGDLPAAALALASALALAPQHHEWRSQLLLLKRQMCDWGGADVDCACLTPQAATVLTDDPETQKAAAIAYAQQKFGSIKVLPSPRSHCHERVRVGYLSSDFHAHATSYLMAELFELHNRKRFEIFAYSYGVDDNSEIRARLKSHAEHFIELASLTARGAAERIRQDEIDVLVDLKGYTRGSRVEILAYRPAPVQIHWLGYPGTLGAGFIDYFVGDGVTVPPSPSFYVNEFDPSPAKSKGLLTQTQDFASSPARGEEPSFVRPDFNNDDNFTEKILRMPHCYQINDRLRAIAEPLPRAAYGLPDGAFVFASFNQTYKITPEVFALWRRLLQALPEAVLWLYQSNVYAPDALRRAAGDNGIDPARLIFAPPLPLEQHLARYAHVDLALDTHPVGGHTTTSDALWAGTPVVVWIGRSFAARVAASVLTAAGLPELICASAEGYIDLALSLAKDREKLHGFKHHLTSKRLSLPLFDTPRFVKDWEALLLSVLKN